MKKIQSEEQLSIAFEEAISNGSWTAHYPRFDGIFRELDCLQGRPDFVGLHTESTDILADYREKLASVLRIPSLTKIISLLHYSAPRTGKYLLFSSGLSLPVFQRSIRGLKSLGLIEACGQSKYILSPLFPRIQWELWAFEIKLEYWQRALYQALQYRAFAHRVSVVLPERWVHRAARSVNRFRLLNVGLIALDIDSKALRFLNRPRKRLPASRFHHLFALGRSLQEQPAKSNQY